MRVMPSWSPECGRGKVIRTAMPEKQRSRRRVHFAHIRPRRPSQAQGGRAGSECRLSPGTCRPSLQMPDAAQGKSHRRTCVDQHMELMIAPASVLPAAICGIKSPALKWGKTKSCLQNAVKISVRPSRGRRVRASRWRSDRRTPSRIRR